eukprot:3538701-Pyramimonas_sp.AAC.1
MVNSTVTVSSPTSEEAEPQMCSGFVTRGGGGIRTGRRWHLAPLLVRTHEHASTRCSCRLVTLTTWRFRPRAVVGGGVCLRADTPPGGAISWETSESPLQQKPDVGCSPRAELGRGVCRCALPK